MSRLSLFAVGVQSAVEYVYADSAVKSWHFVEYLSLYNDEFVIIISAV